MMEQAKNQYQVQLQDHVPNVAIILKLPNILKGRQFDSMISL